MTNTPPEKLRILLMQLPVPNNPQTNVPLALGYLKAYAHAQGLLDHAEIEILPRALADHAGDALLVREIVARRPDVVGASLYTWNSERTLGILERVKQHLPQVRVLAGGPDVQRDNTWVLEHPAVDVAVVGEGEQTFADLLRCWTRRPDHRPLHEIPGIAFRDAVNNLIVTGERVALSDLSVVPSPYLLGYLELPPASMLMIEVSRWCPYGCSFCLYGRNMGAKLGNRYFGLERVLHEIAWGREHGATRVHFIEANLNLVPLFWPLMGALEQINADQRMTFYAELRGEHLTDEVVAALDRCNVRYVEVGLQTANLVALRASHRRTDLAKWAAGTRRLYARDIEVYLDVILGLPADDAAGVQETIEFIQREQLGPYDVFTLQVLPATAVREQATAYGLRYQQRPPYYVLETDRFSASQLRQLRRTLKLHADLDPNAIDGMPQPRATALTRRVPPVGTELIGQLWLADAKALPKAEIARRLGNHVDVVVRSDQLDQATLLLNACIAANPTGIIDLYILCSAVPPAVEELSAWRNMLQWQPGYLDRVAVYGSADLQAEYVRVSPRCFLVLPWTSTIAPAAYDQVAQIIWQFHLGAGEYMPFGAWRAAGGAGIWLHLDGEDIAQERAALLADIQAWQQASGRMVWPAAEEAVGAIEDVSVYAGRI